MNLNFMKLRDVMRSQNITYYLVPSEDPHQSEYVDDYFKRLIKLKDGSLLESYEENELKNLYRNLLENSVAYSLMSRCDIETKFYFEADDFISIELFNTPEMLGVIGNSFQEESNSLLNVISRITKELIIQNRTFENNNRLVDDKIEKMNINYIGAEIVFEKETSPVIQESYLEMQKKKGRILWGNAILYSSRVPLAAGHSDDVSLTDDPAKGWGWLADKGFDIIQTDWTKHCVDYLKENNYRK